LIKVGSAIVNIGGELAGWFGFSSSADCLEGREEISSGLIEIRRELVIISFLI
jgi:hypothetical protein